MRPLSLRSGGQSDGDVEAIKDGVSGLLVDPQGSDELAAVFRGWLTNPTLVFALEQPADGSSNPNLVGLNERGLLKK